MRILHCIETIEPGGAESILVDIASSLPMPYESVGLVFEEGWTSKALTQRGVKNFSLPLTRGFDIGWFQRFRRFLIEHRIDLVHTHEFTMSCYAGIVTKWCGLPHIITMHGKNYYPDRAYRRMALRYAIRSSAVSVAVSDDLRTFMCATLSLPTDYLRVVHNGIDTTRFSNSDALKRESLAMYPGISGKFSITILAALFENKNHALLIQAFKRFTECCSNAMLVIAGEGPEEHNIRQLVRASGLDDFVYFAGFVDRPELLLSISDVVVLPSRSEGLPLSLAEAMAMDCAVVASDVGGVGELITNDESGLLFESGDEDGLCAALNRLYNDEELRQTLSVAGSRRVRRNFSKSMMLSHYQAIYQEACRD